MTRSRFSNTLENINSKYQYKKEINIIHFTKYKYAKILKTVVKIDIQENINLSKIKIHLHMNSIKCTDIYFSYNNQIYYYNELVIEFNSIVNNSKYLKHTTT